MTACRPTSTSCAPCAARLGRRLAIGGPGPASCGRSKQELDEAAARRGPMMIGERCACLRARIAAAGRSASTARCRSSTEFDLRYNNRVNASPAPTPQAVMFCLMDVSGSMDEERKDIAKRFFMLLYLFLHPHLRAHRGRVHPPPHGPPRKSTRTNSSTSRESGGTVVSSALELMAASSARATRATDCGTSMARRPRTATTGAMDSAACAATCLARRRSCPVPVLRLCRDHRRRAAEPVARVRPSSQAAHRQFRDAAHRVERPTSTRCSASCSRRPSHEDDPPPHA
jgi:hypothetical protein